MSDLSVHFSSATPQWGTPQAFFDKLDAEFHFQTDVAAEAWNTKCKRFFFPPEPYMVGNTMHFRRGLPMQDGLIQKWSGSCWLNPPYGDPEMPCRTKCKKKRCVERGYHMGEYVAGIADWVKKAHDSAVEGDATVVCLLPNRQDTEWWWDYCRHGEIRPRKGRLKFMTTEGEGDAAPFPSVVVIFNAHLDPGGFTRYILDDEFPSKLSPDPATPGVGGAVESNTVDGKWLASRVEELEEALREINKCAFGNEFQFNCQHCYEMAESALAGKKEKI